MVLEGTERLGDDRNCAIGEFHRRSKVVVQLRVGWVAGIGGGKHYFRIARVFQVPGQVEKMNRFFQDPIADSLDVESPGFGAQSVRSPRKLNQNVLGYTDGAVVDKFLYPAPQ